MSLERFDANACNPRVRAKAACAARLLLIGILAWVAGSIVAGTVAKVFVLLAVALACVAGFASLWSP